MPTPPPPPDRIPKALTKRSQSISGAKAKARIGLSFLLVGLLVSGLLLMTLVASLPALAQSQSQAQLTPTAEPTPTPPSYNRPNLHLYLMESVTDPATGAITERPLVGVLGRFYTLHYDQTTQTQKLSQLFTGASSAQNATTTSTTTSSDGKFVSDQNGRISVDVTGLATGVYYLELREPLSPGAGSDQTALILPRDPNAVESDGGRPIGQTDPQTRYMSVLALLDGPVVYVYSYHIKPLVKSVGITPAPGSLTELAPQRTISRPDTQSWLYRPPFGSELGQLVSSSPQNSTGSPTPGASNGNNSGSLSPTPTFITLVQPGLSGQLTPSTASSDAPFGQAQATNPATVVPSPMPTPTIPCRYCVPVNGASNTASSAAQTAYARADAARNGSDRATPTAIPAPMLTQRAAAAATATILAQVQGSTITSSTSTSNDNNGGGSNNNPGPDTNNQTTAAPKATFTPKPSERNNQTPQSATVTTSFNAGGNQPASTNGGNTAANNGGSGLVANNPASNGQANQGQRQDQHGPATGAGAVVEKPENSDDQSLIIWLMVVVVALGGGLGIGLWLRKRSQGS